MEIVQRVLVPMLLLVQLQYAMISITFKVVHANLVQIFILHMVSAMIVLALPIALQFNV